MMNPLFPRRYLAENVETALLDAIRENRFGEFLPGERRLATILGVSRPTLRIALGVLTKQGHLRIEQGRRTRIVNPGDSPKETVSTGRVMLLSKDPIHLLSPAMLFAIDLIRGQLEERGLRLEYRSCHAFQHAEPDRGLDRLVTEDPSDAWLLLHAPARVQEWFSKKQIPAIIVGSPADGVELPGLDTDFKPAVRHAFGKLTKLGHPANRIALLIPDLALPGHRAMREGFIEAGGTESAVLRHPMEFDGISEWVDRRFVRVATIPSAVIVAWPKMTISLVTRLGLGHGWKIPEKLSVICLSDDPAFAMVQPPVDHYRRDVQRYVSLMVRLILRTTKRISEVDETRNLMPEYIKGGTISTYQAPAVK
jgi:DNA-binding LacI/PurR family transcriptional regulator